MKVKSIYPLLFCLALSGAATAQMRFQIGFTAGGEYSSLHSDLFTTSSGRLAPVVGCSFLAVWRNSFELNQEVAFTMKGARARAVYFLPEARPEEHTYAYHYYTFETALFAGWQLGKDIPLRVQGGAFFGANFHTLDRSQRELMVANYTDINEAIRAPNLNDAFAGIDFGPAVGLSAGEGRFRGSVRYYRGVCNLYRHIDFVPRGPGIHSSALRLSLTYFLD